MCPIYSGKSYIYQLCYIAIPNLLFIFNYKLFFNYRSLIIITSS